MTEEEILRKKLDRLNKNSHYGIMIDTEITSIVRNLIKRLEEKEMNATSVQTIENVKEMHFTIEKACTDEISKVIVGASTNDDIFEFHFSGVGCDVFADQWFNAVAEKVYKEDFESERNKRKMMETENTILREKNHKLQKENEKLEKQLNAVTLILDNFRKDHEDILKTQREKHKDEVEQLKQYLHQLEEKDLARQKAYDILEKALNEAQDNCNKWYEKYVTLQAKQDSHKKDHEEPVDNVNHPSHYTGRYECIDVMQDVFGDEATNDFCLCNAFKYIWRARKKNGLEDVKKAVWYLNKYIEEAEKDGVRKGEQI